MFFVNMLFYFYPITGHIYDAGSDVIDVYESVFSTFLRSNNSL